MNFKASFSHVMYGLSEHGGGMLTLTLKDIYKAISYYLLTVLKQ